MTFASRLNLTGSTLLVTGAGAGIGRACAVAAAGLGVERVLLVDIDERLIANVARELGPSIDSRCFGVDASDSTALSSIVASVPHIDLLVNAAGNVSASPLLDVDEREWRETYESHVKSVFTTCRLCVPGMLARGHGRIVNIASVAGKRGGGFLGKSAYSAAKAAVNGLTEGLAREVAAGGVRVNAVNPGLTDTRRLTSLRADSEVWARCIGAVPLGRVAAPAEIAAVVAYLLTDASAHINGETLNVDGGIAME